MKVCILELNYPYPTYPRVEDAGRLIIIAEVFLPEVGVTLRDIGLYRSDDDTEDRAFLPAIRVDAKSPLALQWSAALERKVIAAIRQKLSETPVECIGQYNCERGRIAA